MSTARPLLERRFHAPSLLHTQQLAAALGAWLLPQAGQGVVLALAGDLGAGKTTFVRALARGAGLCAAVPVPSPTFIVAQRFVLPAGVELCHADAYRLGSASEWEAAGGEEMLGPGRLTCVEWAERIPGALPEDRLEVHLVADEAPADDPVAADAAPAAGPVACATPPGGRWLVLRALGPASAACLAAFAAPWPESPA
ncbi:MAG: tRNA (adenosine(37)-N6)-threonylcarbamoyltransferase complex ATPase subunit type 1 TsaE [Planctomycetia bacterium]